MLCFALYLAACVGCASFQRKLIYFPPVFGSETVEQLAGYENLVRWTNSSGRLLGWKRPSPVQPAQGQLLLTHGNAGCAFQCGHYADAVQPAAAFDVFIVEYPGYADMPGLPSERSLYESADAAFQALSTNLVVYLAGESLGTGVATWLAGRYPDRVAGIALLAPYRRLADVGQAHMRIFPVRLLLRDRFPSQDHLRAYHGPVAVLVAGRDLVVPERFGLGLYDSYAGPKRLWSFPQGDHGTLMSQPPKVWKEIVDFWEANRQSGGRPAIDLRR